MKIRALTLLLAVSIICFKANAEVAEVVIVDTEGQEQALANDQEILKTPLFEDALARAGTSQKELGINPDIVATDPNGLQQIFHQDQWESVRKDALRGVYRSIQFRPSSQG